MNFNITLEPESSNNDIANASRCALRTYANNIKYQNPSRAQDILLYVKKLDEGREEVFKRQRKLNNIKRNNEIASIIMAVLTSAKAVQMEYSVHDLRTFFCSPKYKQHLPFFSHVLDLLVESKKLVIIDGFIQL